MNPLASPPLSRSVPDDGGGKRPSSEGSALYRTAAAAYKPLHGIRADLVSN